MNESTIAGPAYCAAARARQHEDAGADDGADAEHGQVQRAERAPERHRFARSVCLAHEHGDALPGPQTHEGSLRR